MLICSLIIFFFFLNGFPDSSGKNPPAMQDALVQFLGQKDPLETG